MENENRYFAISAFWAHDDHQLCVAMLSTEQIRRFNDIADTLRAVATKHPGVIEIVVDSQPMIWLPWDEKLNERDDSEIGGDEWQAAVDARPEDIAQPDTNHVHVTEHGLFFSCEVESDEARTETIPWAALNRF